ncbi:RNA polymerase sigma factor [Marivirga sp. S37H4]|uniref:RNA polymerase sigma factor n=1 Tax=Marivirga aurantiaca TaxID=2802615 RepID=A0A935C814_9BACT|nr:RNA polymerase sigma factor [Marivirga aurantiaca]MBK6265346.1 RNA polymerase sigma factor [Marivirga aurantiaca]
MRVETEKGNSTSNRKKELVRLSQQGDIQCFTILFNQTKPALYAKALQFFGSSPEAKDVLQDTFIKAFSRIGQLRDAGKFNTWLHSVLNNECLLVKRSQSKFVKDGNTLQARLSDKWIQPSDFEKLQEKKELHQGVMHWISHLDEKKQAVILLRFFSEYSSYQEIATLLSIPVGTVRSRVAIAKKELRQLVEKMGDLENLDICDGARSEQEEQFREAWPAFYSGEQHRFLNLFKKDLYIRFTSGKISRGLQRWAQEWDEDLESGVRFRPNQITNSNNLVIVEGPIINPPDKPYHCPPYGSMVLFHHHGKVHKAHIHYASRKINPHQAT